jgi:cell division protease FtsH
MSAFDKVIGFSLEKDELIQFSNMIKDKEKYEKLCGHLPQGILIYGDPGLGKTLMANCFIEESGLKSYTIRRNKGNDDFIASIDETFRIAKENAPSIVFLDDVDKFANEDEKHCDTAEYVAVQAGIDDIRGSDVFVIATANNIKKLPNSLLRPGRFDIQLGIRMPTESDAEKIIKYYLKDRPISHDVDMDDLSKMIRYNSCAEVEEILNYAGVYAASRDHEKIEMNDFVKAVLRTEYLLPDGFIDEPTEENRKVAIHEAGHIVVREYLNPGSVGFAYVVRDDDEVVGFVRRCKKRLQWDDDALASLAGKAAVELYYSDTSTMGCSSDICKAIEIIRNAMTDEVTLGFGMVDVTNFTPYDNSESQLARGEAVTHAELERYMTMTRKILLENRSFLEEVAEELLNKGVLFHSDIKRIREKYVPNKEIAKN